MAVRSVATETPRGALAATLSAGVGGASVAGAGVGGAVPLAPLAPLNDGARCARPSGVVVAARGREGSPSIDDATAAVAPATLPRRCRSARGEPAWNAASAFAHGAHGVPAGTDREDGGVAPWPQSPAAPGALGRSVDCRVSSLTSTVIPPGGDVESSADMAANDAHSMGREKKQEEEQRERSKSRTAEDGRSGDRRVEEAGDGCAKPRWNRQLSASKL